MFLLKCKEKTNQFLKNEMSTWTMFEKTWFILATIVIVVLSIYWKDSWISFTASVTGVWCVILTGKGKRSSFIFGFINIIFYSLISFKAKYYGEVMLNLLYYLPTNFIGWFAWKKYINNNNGEVIKKRLSFKNRCFVYFITLIAIFGYGFILKKMGGNLPYIDSMSTVVSIVAQILLIKRLMEQWILWIVVDIVTIIMWAINFAHGGESIATLAMWSVYLINACIMFYKWNQEVEKNAI